MIIQFLIKTAFIVGGILAVLAVAKLWLFSDDKTSVEPSSDEKIGTPTYD